MSDIEPADVHIEPQKSEVKPLQLPDEEWSYEKIIDELLRNLASVEQPAYNESGEIVTIRKYQSLCRRLGPSLSSKISNETTIQRSNRCILRSS
jgi:hypothetical protein